jgi:uncharacterized protein (TIGR00251 family)
MKLNVTVVPNAKNLEIIKIGENDYKIKVDAPASEGKANKRLIEILAEHFKVSKYSVSIMRGLKSKNKIVEINL